jgi:hypothetical protein
MYNLTILIGLSIFVIFTICYFIIYAIWSLIEFLFNYTVEKLL